MSELVQATSFAPALGGLRQRLGEPLRKLGLSLSFWDAAGSILDEGECHEPFCRLVCQAGGVCQAAKSALAAQVYRDERASWQLAPSGCLLLGAPVRRRRRVIAAAVGCCPSASLSDHNEELLRTAGVLGMDGASLAHLGRQMPLHEPAEAGYLCQVLEWLMETELARELASQELATLSTNLADTYEELSLLYRITGSMKVTQSATGFFQNLCQEMLEVVQLQAAAIVLHSRQRRGSTEQVVLAGQLELSGRELVPLIHQALGPMLYSAGKPLIDNQFDLHAGAAAEGIKTLIAVPLMNGDKAIGLVVGVNKLAGEFDSVDLKLMGSLGGQAGVFLENHHLYEDLQDLLMGLLHALTASIDAKDPYTCGHSRRVAMISRKLSELSGLSGERVERVYLAGLLHDVGKIGMPEAVLCKPGRLTEEEFNKIKLHPQIGANILGGIRQLEDIIPAVLGHHERPDGRGYPRGLGGDQVPPEALIVGLADAFDAMTSSRTYRTGMPLEAVAAEIRRCSGTQFDGRLVTLLLGMDLKEYMVELWANAGPGEAMGSGQTP